MLHLLLAALLSSYIAPNPPFSRHDVAIGGDAQHTLVAWTQLENGNLRVHIAASGGARDVAMPIRGQLQMSPAVAFDGVNYLVVWQEVAFRITTTYAQRVTATGELLDAPIPLGDYTNGLPPRVAWAKGTYRVTAGTNVTTLNSAGVRTLTLAPSAPADAIDLALPDDATVYARFLPAFCSGFSIPFFTCRPAQNLLVFQPGDTINLTAKPVWLEAADHVVIWSDGSLLYATRDGITQSIALGATNATVAGSLVVYEKNEQLYSIDLDTKKETVLTGPGAVAPALLSRGNGQYTLLYRTTSRPAQLLTIEIGAVRRRTK